MANKSMQEVRTIDIGFSDDRAVVIDGVLGASVVKVFAYGIQRRPDGYVVVGAVVQHNLETDEYTFLAPPVSMTPPYSSPELLHAFLQTHVRNKAAEVRRSYLEQGVEVAPGQEMVMHHGDV
jgi:hypothetical protein